jgi:hypothetical protein
MHRLIACLIGGSAHQPFGVHPITAHSISTDQIYVVASWVGTVELVIVAAVGLGLWFWARCGGGASQVLEPFRPPLLRQQRHSAHDQCQAH